MKLQRLLSPFTFHLSPILLLLILVVGLLASPTYAGDITATLDSTDGTSKFVVKDSAATSRMSILSNGNVGIGTTAPVQRLDIQSSGISTSPLIIHNSAGGNVASITMTGAEDAQLLLRDAAQTTQIFFNTVGSSYFTGGSVGIGTTAPGDRLDVKSPGTGSWGFQVSEFTDGTPIVQAGSWSSDNGAISISDSSNARKVFLYSGGDSYLNGGNVGIGTTGPGAVLDVNGKIRSNTTIEANGTGSNFLLRDTAGSTIFRMTSGTGGDLLFQNDAGSNLGVWKQGGNVGIGTTAPAALFSVGSTSQFQVNSSGVMTAPTPILTGKYDLNDTAVDDDDCTGEQGKGWYDSTDSAWEFCNANSGTPTVLGGGSGAPTDATYITQTADGTLSAEQALASLSSGIMRVATTTGVITSLTDSSGIASNISDETGTGVMVFGTAPTFTTSITDPLVIGGTGTTSDLTLQTTSGVGAAGADMHFLVGNNGATEAMTILNSGNVGIGTTGPVKKLDVLSAEDWPLKVTGQKDGTGATGGVFIGSRAADKGTIQGHDGANAVDLSLQTEGGNLGIGTTGPSVKLEVVGSGNNTRLDVRDSTSGIRSAVGAFTTAGGVGTITNHPFRIYTNDTDRVSIGTNGNVGIGTTGPDEKLVVSVTGDADVIRLTTDQVSGGLVFSHNTGTAARIRATTGGTHGELQFFTAGSERIHVDINGNVGIGTTVPTQTLHVAGTATITTSVAGADDRTLCTVAASGEVELKNGACGTSSRRYKENIEKLGYGLNEINQLNPVFYNYKNFDEEKDSTRTKRRIGFIAEEVWPIVPEVVMFNEEGLVDGVDYAYLVALLTKGIQELDAIVRGGGVVASTAGTAPPLAGQAGVPTLTNLPNGEVSASSDLPPVGDSGGNTLLVSTSATEPATPPKGQAVIYMKEDGKLYLKNDEGKEIPLTGVQWEAAGNGIFYSGGPVGIGLAEKLSMLTIKPPVDKTIAGATDASNTTKIEGVGTKFLSELGVGDRIALSSAPSSYATVTAIDSDTALSVDQPLGQGFSTNQTITQKSSIFRLEDVDGSVKLIVNDLGWVGIGTPRPEAGLHVSTPMKIYNQTPKTGRTNLTIRAGEGQGVETHGHASLLEIQDEKGKTSVAFDAAGNLGIGTFSPESALHVAQGRYAQFENNQIGAPPADDCKEDSQLGRMSIDTKNNRLYICNGARRGWDFVNLSD